MAGAALTSGYLVVYVVAALGSALLARAPGLWSRQGAGVLLRLLAAAVVTLASLYVLLRAVPGVAGPAPAARRRGRHRQRAAEPRRHGHPHRGLADGGGGNGDRAQVAARQRVEEPARHRHRQPQALEP